MQSNDEAIAKFLSERPLPISITKTDSLSSALSIMIENDFSQLPVTDREGVLVGIVSEQSITRHLFHFGDGTTMLDSPVEVLLDDAIDLPRADVDLFTILEQLRTHYAIVITDERKPVGIFTYYDTTNYLREWSEGLIRIQNIEQTLRQYIRDVLETEDAITAALYKVLGADKKDTTKPRKAYDELSFYNHIELIISDSYWDRFKSYFGLKDHFERLMAPVNKARNQLAHFRGNLNNTQLDAVRRAERWIAKRPRKIQDKAVINLKGSAITVSGADATLTVSKGKYRKLDQLLTQLAPSVNEGEIIQQHFSDIEESIDDSLPSSAREHRAWWSNDSTSPYRHSQAWLRSGWEVSDVDFTNELVSFRRTNRSLYKVFWASLVERLEAERPSFKQLTKGYDNYYLLFDSGKKGFYYGWAFSSNRTELWTQLLIDTRHSDSNLARDYFFQLHQQKEDIEADYGGSLEWDDTSMERAVRIYDKHPITIDISAGDLEMEKSWAVESIQRLADSMQSRIADLS